MKITTASCGFFWLLMLSTFSASWTKTGHLDFAQIFHGTSVVIYPHKFSRWPGNSTFIAVNFYCYFTSAGYLSFGWWLPAEPEAGCKHCDPGSNSYDWYEFTTASRCTRQGCRNHIVNYNSTNPKVPAFEEDYVLAALNIGNGALGRLGLSYFDKEGGGYAVGTRRILSDVTADKYEVEECSKALRNFRLLEKKRGLDLPFSLVSLCSVGEFNVESQLLI